MRIHGIEESDTYQAIMEEGEIKGMRRNLLQLGRRRFGPPSPAIESALGQIVDPERLARLIDVLLDVSSWDDLLATP